MTVSTAGAVIENLDIAGKVTIRADRVTIRNCRVRGGAPYSIQVASGSGILIEDCELDGLGGTSAAILGSGFTVRRTEIHRTASDGIKPVRDVVIEGCWFHHLGMADGAHADGVQMVKGGRVVIRGNNFDLPIGLPGFRSNAACIIGTNDGPVDDVLIEGNRLDGGNYTLYCGEKVIDGVGTGLPTNVRILGNVFGRHYRYGWASMPSRSVTWRGNTWEDTGAPVTLGGVQPPQPPTIALVLVDAAADRDLAPLADGATIDLGTTGRALNLRAEPGAAAGSVRFDLDGGARRHTENSAPFVLAGERNGDYAAWTPSVGVHTLVVTAYERDDAAGAVIGGLTLRFTVVAP